MWVLVLADVDVVLVGFGGLDGDVDIMSVSTTSRQGLMRDRTDVPGVHLNERKSSVPLTKVPSLGTVSVLVHSTAMIKCCLAACVESEKEPLNGQLNLQG